MSLEHGFELLRKEHFDYLNGDLYEYRHPKSGARLVLVKNDDKNKVFTIGFRTPSNNSTGVAHIMEHSTLCGSDKFPVKEPFVELAKGSVNTFLNAMTYSDRTVYPIATTNDKDYRNLMDVYLDAVFHPKIYDSPYTFMQEGWHYHLEDKDEPIRYNGVVYNEMKGVYSDPSSIHEREIYKALYPDTIYSQESGGDPDNIPELTYEDFINFHKKYYHPSNSYIYLYGDIDIDEQLEYLDGWLNEYDAIEVDSEIPIQKPLEGRVEADFPYPITPGEPKEGKDRLSISYLYPAGMTHKDEVIATVLMDYLLEKNSSVLQKAILDQGLAGEVSYLLDSSILQPNLSIILKDTKLENKGRLLETINEVITNEIENGVNREEIEAQLNHKEFRLLETLSGEGSSFPRGLGLGLSIYNDWIHDRDPFTALSSLEDLKEAREMLHRGEMEDYLRKLILENPSQALIGLYPDEELRAKNEKELAEKLEAYKNSLSEEELDELVGQTQELLRRQMEEDTQEALATIPRLAVSEIEREGQKIESEMLDVDGVPVLYVEGGTTDIIYLDMNFDFEGLELEEVNYLPILQVLLGNIGSEDHTYEELNRELDAEMGGFSTSVELTENLQTHEVFYEFSVNVRMLLEKLQRSLDIVEEILLRSDFTQKEVVRSLIKQERLALKSEIQNRGNSLALKRLQSSFSERNRMRERLSGIEKYEMIKDLDENFDERWDELMERLPDVLSKLINRKGLIFGLACRRENLDEVLGALKAFIGKLREEDIIPKTYNLEPLPHNEGFITSGTVMFNAKGGRVEFKEPPNVGSFRVLRTLLGMDYLWNAVRVMGGAYGVDFNINRLGNIGFTTFRDPNLEKSYENFDNVVEYIDNLDLSQEEVDKYIIGAISPMEAPMTALRKMRLATNWLHSGKTNEDLQLEREQVLDTSLEDLKKNAGIIKEALEQNNICTIGAESAIKQSEGLFEAVDYIQ